jgi:branched-chain amino acid transport system ATP-binding protein
MEALRVEKLSKDFGGVRAVHDLSFHVQEGEHLAIIGPNGAGKTTLFNLLGGQLSPSGGKVYFFGQDITHMATHRRAHLGIARSFQIVSLFMNLTVLGNILLALQGTKAFRYQMVRPVSSYKTLFTKAEELLSSMDLWSKKDEPLHSISYGEQRKLEIAVSLASEPRLLLLDEPSCGLTAIEGADVVSRIRNLSSNITVIVVAHDMDLVFGVAQRIMVLHYGEFIAEGTCEQIRVNDKVKEIYMGMEIAKKC